MYPYFVIDLGEHLRLGLYDICLMIAILSCLVLYRVFADRQKFKARIQNFALIAILFSIGGGYYAAALVQTFYNWNAALASNPEAKFWDYWGTGATFYGGLVGGVLIFLVLYFGIGTLLFKDKKNLHYFFPIANIAGAVIPLAHGIGRIGCLMAGCCHGARSDAWYAIPMNIPGDGTSDMVKVVPVQLFEALFLLALAAFLLFSFWKKWRYQMPIYMIAYSLWRFVAEYLRDDYRGQTVIKALTPSELVSVVLLVGGIALLAVELWLDHRKGGREA